MKTTKEMIAVMQAFENGAEIEAKPIVVGDWEEETEPEWDWVSFDYRIKKQPKEIWMVKLADRITNLQPPPYYWTKNKIDQYLNEAIEIHEALKDANDVLSSRLLSKIEQYKKYAE